MLLQVDAREMENRTSICISDAISRWGGMINQRAGRDGVRGPRLPENSGATAFTELNIADQGAAVPTPPPSGSLPDLPAVSEISRILPQRSHTTVPLTAGQQHCPEYSGRRLEIGGEGASLARKRRVV